MPDDEASSEIPPPAIQDLEPYVLYRRDQASAECATWRLSTGETALAMFRDEASAQRYRAAAELGEAWQTHRPPADVLAGILRHALASGVRLAVLEPDQERAIRIFDLAAVLQAIDQAESPPEE